MLTFVAIRVEQASKPGEFAAVSSGYFQIHVSVSCPACGRISERTVHQTHFDENALTIAHELLRLDCGLHLYLTNGFWKPT